MNAYSRIGKALRVSFLAAGMLAGAAVTGSQAADYDQLTIYTGLPEAEVPTYLGAFERDTGIKINYVRLSAGEMLTRIQTEAANPNASVMHAVSSESFMQASSEGLLEPYQSPELANVADKYKDPKGVWNPYYMGALAIAINRDWFERNKIEPPTSWKDLLDEKYKGQIAMAHPTTSGTSYSVVAMFVQMWGEDEAFKYLEKLNGNIRQYTKAGSAAPMQVALGEAAIALTYAHDALKPAEEGYPVEVVFPTDGTGFEVGGIALIKGGFEKEQENARKFIDWCLSVAGQEALIESKSNRLPINSKAKATEGLKTIEQINVIDYDAVWAAENRKRLTEKFLGLVDNATSLK